MTDDNMKKAEHIKLVDQPAAEDVFDDVEALRKVAVLKVSRRVIPVNVRVGKPGNNVFFRSHPEMSLDAMVLIGDGESDDFYFIHPRMLNDLRVLPRMRKVTIGVIYAWPGGTISLWPVPCAEESRIACWRSARAAYEISKTQWTQLIWNGDARDYDVTCAEGINTEPIWPKDQSFNDLLRLGFSDKIIDSDRHPYVLRLRGLAE